MRTANPALGAKSFGGFVGVRAGDRAEDAMTIQGTVNRACILLAIAMTGAAWTWRLFFRADDLSVLLPWLYGGSIVGLVFGIVTIFKKTWSPVTAPIYAA